MTFDTDMMIGSKNYSYNNNKYSNDQLFQAVLVDKTLYIAGCIGFDPKTMEIVGGGVEAETSQALTNMGAVLKAAGCTHNNVVKTTVLLNDIKDSAAVNEVYKKFFPTHYPARTGFQVQSIIFSLNLLTDKDSQVEFEM